jgi:hypothetical protein
MSNLLTNWAQVAPGLTPLVALVAVVVAWRQLRLNRLNQRETIAKTLYREYLKTAIEKPVFANPDLAKFDYNAATIDDSHEKFESYEWYISYMLHACEEILGIQKSDLWRHTIRSQLNLHRSYLCGRFHELGLQYHYTKEIQALLNEICGGSTTRAGAANL